MSDRTTYGTPNDTHVELKLVEEIPMIKIADGTIARPGDRVTVLWYGTGEKGQKPGEEDPVGGFGGERLQMGARFFTFVIKAIGKLETKDDRYWIWENAIDAHDPADCYAHLAIAVRVALERSREELKRLEELSTK